MIPTDERNFEHPNEFIPERWTSRPELTRNASVYSPFSIGKFSIPYESNAMQHRFLLCLQVADMPFDRSVQLCRQATGLYGDPQRDEQYSAPV